MAHHSNPYAALIFVALLAAAAPPALAGSLPDGVGVRESEDGLALADQAGRPLYRLDQDRVRQRKGYASGATVQRCVDLCAHLWRPAPPPPAFKPVGDWGVVQSVEGPQLTYKGDPLYGFAGKDLSEAVAASRVFPPYFSSYAAKPIAWVDGVPSGTLYWHPALYRPPAPDVPTPAGVVTRWSKTAYVFADAGGRNLFTPRSGRICEEGCDALEPLPAPLAARPVGDWRPIEDKSGARDWSYRGRIVYRPREADADAPGPGWLALTASD